VLAVSVSLGLSSYALSIPFVLTGVHGYAGVGYDDGVYMGVAVLFVHGTIPYRDYVLVQPPGIVVLVSPIDSLGRVSLSRASPS
jgi:hypothetical protein